MPTGRRPRGRLRPRATGPDRAHRRGARPRPRERPRRPVRRLVGDDPQGPRRPRGGRPRRPDPRWRDRARAQPARARVRPPRAAPAGREGGDRRRWRRRLVRDGESIVMDASTTALAVARQLKARGGWSQLTVITNGLRLASELAGSPGIIVADARRPRPLGGPLGRRPARRRPVQPDQRPEGLPRRRRLHPRIRPERRDRRGGADQARRWSPRRARSSRSSTTPSGSAPPSRRSARPTRSTTS